MKKIELLILVLILCGAFIVRVYRLNNPIGDWHAWRQADTSAVSRNFVKNGFDILHPRFEDISNIPSGLDNPHGYRFVEFPLYNLAQASLYKFIGLLSLEEWGRIVTIISSVLATLFIFLIVSKHSNRKIGLLSAFFYAFIPYDIYYGRTILPDPSSVMTILGGIYFFDVWVDSSDWIWFILSIVFTASSFLLKPYTLFFVLPMIVLSYKKWGLRFLANWKLWVFTIISVIPLFLWRKWISQYPEGIPVSAWLFNGNNIRFHPAFFRWIFYERLTKLISGYFGIVIFLFGFIRVIKLKNWLFFASFFLSSLIYVSTIATGNVQHDYYQIYIMPSVAIFYGIGGYFLYQWSIQKIPLGKILLLILTIGALGYGWFIVKDYFDIDNRALFVAGDAVNRLTSKNALVIAPNDGDTTFLYATQRQGWPAFEHPLPQLIQMGADYLVLANPQPKDYDIGKTYKIVSATKDYILFDLHQKP